MKITLDVVIRPAKRDDLRDLDWYGHQSPVRRHIASILDRREVGETELLVAEVNGFAAARLGIDFTRARDATLLWSFAVVPHLQRLGIGTAMVAAAEKLARERGFAIAEIHVEKGNSDAQRLYERLGYEVVGEERAARPPEWVLRKAIA
jgi:ribosomal protein S18 acetylase RimI-like enzyme